MLPGPARFLDAQSAPSVLLSSIKRPKELMRGALLRKPKATTGTSQNVALVHNLSIPRSSYQVVELDQEALTLCKPGKLHIPPRCLHLRTAEQPFAGSCS